MFKKLFILGTVLVLGSFPLYAGKFGNPDDVEFARTVWQAMTKASLVGDNAFVSQPYKGFPPHGIVLDTVEGEFTVGNEKNILIIKRNYGGEKEPAQVMENPAKYLKAVTIMFRKPAGYDSANGDWFYVKYSPQGKVLKNPKGVSLAGRVGAPGVGGCIGCHIGAPGKDFVFRHNRYTMQ
jgi:hypothetical protein